MAKPNTNFELTVADLELIEAALRSRKASLADGIAGVSKADPELKDTLYGIHDLLGRLHNQKEFYRPASGAFISG